MDREAFRAGIEGAMRRLPPSLVGDLATLARKIIVEHRQSIEAVVPALVAELGPQLQALFVEKAMGFLNVDEVQADVMAVFAKFGIRELPEPTQSRS